MEKLIDDVWENCTNLRDIHSNCSLNCSFKGHSLHPRVTAFVDTFSFTFSPIQRSFNFPNLKEINCTPKLCNKINHCALSRAKDHHTSLPSPWIEKQYWILECTCSHSPDYVIFMHSTGRTVQTEESPWDN